MGREDCGAYPVNPNPNSNNGGGSIPCFDGVVVGIKVQVDPNQQLHTTPKREPLALTT